MLLEVSQGSWGTEQRTSGENSTTSATTARVGRGEGGDSAVVRSPSPVRQCGRG